MAHFTTKGKIVVMCNFQREAVKQVTQRSKIKPLCLFQLVRDQQDRTTGSSEQKYLFADDTLCIQH